MLVYWHGDVFYGIDNATLCRYIVNVLISQLYTDVFLCINSVSIIPSCSDAFLCINNVSIIPSCSDAFLCIDISTLHQYISLYQYPATPLHLPSRKRSASTQSLPSDHRETQPFVPVIQRSADDPSNSRETTTHSTLNQIFAPSTHFPIYCLLPSSPL